MYCFAWLVRENQFENVANVTNKVLDDEGSEAGENG